jgi:formylglycine-generating enzyme required for sulfatase activity
MTTSRRIFLASTKEDKPALQQLHRELKAQGFEPWLDVEDLRPEQARQEAIPAIVRGARVFALCLSSRSVARLGDGQNDLRPAVAAFGKCPPGSIHLVPLRLDGFAVPDLRLSGLHRSLSDLAWIDLFADDGRNRLLRRLTEGAGLTPAASGAPEEPEGPRVFRDIDAPWCPEMVVIPAGSFTMGSPPDELRRYKDEGPQVDVRIAEPFALGRYPVTFEEYDAFVAATKRERPSDAGWGRGRRPVINVSWHDAQAYVEWLNWQTGSDYWLPSEAEWEYACRAGTTTPFSSGPTISVSQANYDGTFAFGSGRRGLFRQETAVVGSFAANAFGLSDMHGNVWEWCADNWHDSYLGAPVNGTAWLDDGDPTRRVCRGGSWNSSPWFLRSAVRNRLEPDYRDHNLGFRVARIIE